MSCASWHNPTAPRREEVRGVPPPARSPVYDPPVLMRRSRTKRAWLATEKRDKAGRKYVGQDNVLVTAGVETREAESMMLKVAEEEGASHKDIRIVPFGKDEDLPYR